MQKLKKLLKKTVYGSLILFLLASQLFLSAPVFAADNCNNTLGSNGKVSQSKVNKCLNQSPVVKDLQNIVNFLSAGVGIIVIGVIILGGIQYSMAGDNANATGAAKTRITNGLLALFAFIFAWAFLQWLIPGGIFG